MKIILLKIILFENIFKFDQCNNPLIDIINKYFDLSSIREAFLLPYKENHSTQITLLLNNSTERTTFTIAIQNSSTLTLSMSADAPYSVAKKCSHISINLILILLIIFLFDVEIFRINRTFIHNKMNNSPISSPSLSAYILLTKSKNKTRVHK